MDHRISSSELARRLRDVLGRVRYRGEALLVERHNVPIARIAPVPLAARPTLREALAIWMAASEPDPGFADDLELVGKLDRPAQNPWDS